VFIGSGAGLPSFMNIEGEDLLGVYSARVSDPHHLMKAYREGYDTPIAKSRSVAVVGGAMCDGRRPLRKTHGRGKRLYCLPPFHGGTARSCGGSASRAGRRHHLQTAQ
jgi:hypothetical protein